MAIASESNLIGLRGDFTVDELQAVTTTVKPGHLIERVSTGKVQLHSTAGGHAERMWAEVDLFQGANGLSVARNKTSAYAAADWVRCITAERGNEVQARLASGQNVAIGAKLVSDGLGCLTAKASLESAADADKQDVVAIALEAVNNSGGTLPFIQVRVV